MSQREVALCRHTPVVLYLVIVLVRTVECSSLNSVCFYITGIVNGHTAAAVLNDAVYALANT